MLRSRIPQIIAELDDKLREGVVDVAERIADGAKERVSVDTGALRDAIHVEADEESVRVVAGDGDVFYGHIIEAGGVNTPPHPFLVPAFEAERQDLEDIVSEHLDNL